MSFDIEEAIEIANYLASLQASRNLTDVEISVLRGAWEKLEYDQIAVQNQYSTSYISQDAAPKLWKLLSSALGEKVRKSNFKEALKRSWVEHSKQEKGRDQPNQSINPGTSQATTGTAVRSPKEQPTPPTIYIERPPVEAMCCEALAQPGALIRIKAPKYMGKTSLANHSLNQLAESGYRTFRLSFELADRQTHLTDLNKLLRWMCLNIARELNLPNQIDEIWDEEGIGAKVSCTAYFEEYLLSNSEQPLILCLDNVDLLFPHPEVYEDFFGLLRSWYEKARNRPIWKNLRLIIVHATDVYIRLNINQSPFNVGLAVELPEFSESQVKDFAQQSGLTAKKTQVSALMSWVGGHPYLLEKAFTYLNNHPETALQTLLADEAALMSVYQNHLRDQWMILQDNPQLAEACLELVQIDSPSQLDPMVTYQLQSMGLVKPEGNKVVIRCQLYSTYFEKNLR